MMFICKAHKLIMMDAIDDRGLNRLNDQVTGCTLKKTCDRKKELLIQRKPFRYLLFPAGWIFPVGTAARRRPGIFIIIYPGNPLFYKIDII